MPRFTFSDSPLIAEKKDGSSVQFQRSQLREWLTVNSFTDPLHAAEILRHVGATVVSDAEIRSIGREVELNLGKAPDRRSVPDFGAWELKTTTGTGNWPHICMMGMAPHWLESREAIIKKYGHHGTLKIERVKPPPAKSTDSPLALAIGKKMLRVVEPDGTPLMEWSLKAFCEHLDEKAANLIVLRARRDSPRRLVIPVGLVFDRLETRSLQGLVERRGHYTFYFRPDIPRSTSRANYEFFMSLRLLRKLYRRVVSLRQDGVPVEW
jgi:hypothetical protein